MYLFDIKYEPSSVEIDSVYLPGQATTIIGLYWQKIKIVMMEGA